MKNTIINITQSKVKIDNNKIQNLSNKDDICSIIEGLKFFMFKNNTHLRL